MRNNTIKKDILSVIADTIIRDTIKENETKQEKGRCIRLGGKDKLPKMLKK